MKHQRLCLAQDEYNHLNNALSTLGASRTSCECNLTESGFCFYNSDYPDKSGFSSFKLISNLDRTRYMELSMNASLILSQSKSVSF